MNLDDVGEKENDGYMGKKIVNIDDDEDIRFEKNDFEINIENDILRILMIFCLVLVWFSAY